MRTAHPTAVPARAPLNRAFRILSITAAGIPSALLLALFAAEGAARLLVPHASLGWTFEAGPYHRALVTHPPEGAAGPASFTTNRWGMRGDAPPLPWRPGNPDTWLALGSSTTLCSYLDDANAWPRRLQEDLRKSRPSIWIGNAAGEGLTSKSLLLETETVVRALRPGGILVLPGLPDLVLNFSDRRRERGSPYDEAFSKRTEAVAHPKAFRERFALVHAFRLWKRGRASAGPALNQDRHERWVPPPLRSGEDSLPPMPDLLASLPAFRDHLKRMMAIARRDGVRAVFLTQPIAYEESPFWASRETQTLTIRGREYRISAATERRLLDAFNADLLSLCRSESAECLDLAALIPRDTAYFYDGSHFNDAGATLAAETIATYLSAHP